MILRLFSAPAPTLRIDVLPSGSLTVIAPRGDLDITVATELSAVVDRVLAADPLMVVLDLRGLSFIDTAGISAVLSAGRACEASRRQFILIRGTPDLDRVLRAAGVYGPFDVVSDLDHLGAPR